MKKYLDVIAIAAGFGFLAWTQIRTHKKIEEIDEKFDNYSHHFGYVTNKTIVGI